MCCCGKKKVVPDDDPTLFRWDKYRKMADAWRAYKDEQYNVGIQKYLKKKYLMQYNLEKVNL